MQKNNEQAIKDGCYFDRKQADRAIKFIQTYCIPMTTGKRIQLLDWQRTLIENLYGWRNKHGGKRFTRLICSMAKQGGKTLVQACIILYELLGNLTLAPYCVSASTTRQNASKIYESIAFSIRQNDKLNKICECADSYKRVVVPDRNGKYLSFSADAGNAEGEGITCCVVDELHAHQSDRLYRSLEFSPIARGGLLAVISTAGIDQSTAWYSLFQYASKVEADEIIDPQVLPAIYTTTPDDDIDDPATWRKANPSLGFTFSEDAFKQDLTTARQQGTSSLTSFRRYRLNQWLAGDNAYLDPTLFDECAQVVNEAELKTAPLYAACDLSQTTDPCSIAMCWVLDDKRYYIRVHSWVCEGGVKRREQQLLPRYRQWESEKKLTITRGTVNDYREIKSYIRGLRERYNLKMVAFDAYNAIEMCAELQAERLPVFRFGQTHKQYNDPVKQFEIAVREGRMKFEPNAMLRWALQNTQLDYDSYENCKPSREKSSEKIDPAVASIMAFGTASVQESPANKFTSRYETAGLFTI